MFFPGTLNIFVPGDKVFMLFKYMCHNISIKKNRYFDRLFCGNTNPKKCILVFYI